MLSKSSNLNLVTNKLEKVIEGGFFNKGIIGSNYGPYTMDLENVIEKGGGINPNGNAILIDTSKNHKGWAKAIEKIVKNPEILEIMRNNLNKTVVEKCLKVQTS